MRTLLRTYTEAREFREAVDLDSLPHLLRALTHLTGSYPGFVGEGSDKRLDNPSRSWPR